MKESERDLALRALAGMSAALGSAVAASHQYNDLATLISFAGVVAPDAVVPLRSMGQQRLQRLIPWFFTGVERGAAKPIAEAVTNEDAAEALFEAYRRMVNTPAEFAANALGRLAGHYIRKGQPVDQLFRAAARVVEELGPHEYDDLRQLVLAIGEREQRSYQSAIDFSLNPPNDNIEGGGAQVFYRHHSGQWRGLKDASEKNIEKTTGMYRVLFLLKAHGLAKDVTMMQNWGGKTLPSESGHIDIEVFVPLFREILSEREG